MSPKEATVTALGTKARDANKTQQIAAETTRSFAGQTRKRKTVAKTASTAAKLV